MLLISAKINNFKSIGNYQNTLDVEKATTVLIGKNESGKSNVLESIGLLNLWATLPQSYVKLSTRGQEQEPTVTLTFSFSEQDKEVFPNSNGDTVITYTSTQVTFSGGLADLISNDDELNADIFKLFTAIDSNEFKLSASAIANLKSQTLKLRNISENIYSSLFGELNSAKGTINSSAQETKSIYMDLVDKISKRIKEYYNLIPQVYYRKAEETLKDTYTFDEIKKLVDSNNIFQNLMIAAGIDKDTLLKSFQNKTEPDKKTCKKQVENKINALVREFNEFYKQENIAFDFDIEGQSVKLYVYTSDKYMSFSERSNGLKWYFNLFVDVKAKTNNERPILFLLDEPGVYLHVRAQKQVIDLFEHLCDDKNQVIYTTHSSFMINPNNIYNVRAIEKNEDGYSYIYTSIYNHKLSTKSKLETLSPLIEAFGMDLSDNIGPQYQKNNIVVEGITDSMYINSMLNYFEIKQEDRPNIVPCAGVDNVNLVISILIGWGCEYRALLDYDSQGYAQYKKITKKTLLTDENKVLFVNLKTPNTELDVKGKLSETIESLIAPEDNEKLTNKYEGTTETKTLAAKEFYDKVSSGGIIPSKKTINNFKKLFEALSIKLS